MDFNVEQLMLKSRELRRSGNYDEAIRLLTAAIETVNDPRLYYSRGVLFDLQGQTTQAIADFASAIALDPTNPKPYFQRGCILELELRKEKEALADFFKVLELEPNNVEAHQHISFCSLLVGPISLAWEHAKAAEEIDPNNALTYFCLGEVEISLKRFSDAAKSFSRSVELDPDDPSAWSGLGSAYRQMGGEANLIAAVVGYTKAIGLAPQSAGHLLSRAAVQLELGMANEAIKDLHLALTLNPDDTQLMLINLDLARAEKQMATDEMHE